MLQGPDIFISYARGDQGTARLFAESFVREGFSVWWDDAIHSGETFDEVIEKELRSARAVVVLWSPRSVLSRWVRAEATLADRKKTLAPVIIEPCDRPIIFELTHTVDLSHWTGDRADRMWQVFVNDLHRLVGKKPDAAGTEDGDPGLAPPAGPPPASLAPAGDNPAGPSAAHFTPDNMNSLITALASLQKAMEKPGEAVPPYLFSAPSAAATPAGTAPRPPAPAPLPELEESEETQFYTGTDEFALLMGDEFHCLELARDDGDSQRYLVGPLGVKIGRTAPADVVLTDAKISRSHCLVELKDGQLYVSDLNSTNGTYVDGQRVEGAAVLPAGSTLMVGRFTLVHEVRSRADL